MKADTWKATMCLPLFYSFTQFVVSFCKSNSILQSHILLSRRLQHIPDPNPISGGGIIHHDMCHSTHQLAILKNGTAAHE